MNVENIRTERYEYIDFLKGIAAISIICIHTAFYSGTSYVPLWFENLTLFLDVPFFFYLSGWGSSFHKSDIERTAKELGIIWVKWILFISALAFFCFISRYLPHPFEGVSDLRDLVNNYMFNVSFSGFSVIKGSVWFIQHYFVVVFINTFIVCMLQNKWGGVKFQLFYMTFLAIAFVWISYNKYFFGVDCRYYLFYGFFWMMGRNRVGATKTRKRFFGYMALIIFGIIFTSYLQALPLYDIQTAKFPPTIKYGFVSLVAILFTKYIEPYITHTNKWINHIGRNAIYYYFAQGVGSSLIYYIVPIISAENWLVKFIIIFLINVFLTTIIAETLRVMYKFAFLFMRFLLRKQ